MGNAHTVSQCRTSPSRTMPGSRNFDGKRHEIIGFTAGVDAKEPIVVKVEDNAHTVYIDGCKGTVKDGSIIVKVEGKFNALTMNNCQRIGLVFEDGVSCVEIINCKKVQAQVTGLLNNWQVDKSNEVNLFISEQSRENIHILSAQTEAFNVNFITGSDGELKEFGLPEQMKSTWKGDKFVTEVFEATVSESM